jgi:hypothetical protein
MPAKNIAALNDALMNKIPAAIIKGLREDIEQSAAAMVAQMKFACPIGPAKTHATHVRDTITSYWSTKKTAPLELRLMVIAGSRTGTLVSNKNGKQFQLAKLIEFGTQHRHATPFFWPIWRANKRKIRRNATTKINAVIAGFASVSLTDDQGNGAEAA